jgi:multidrug efflux pump
MRAITDYFIRHPVPALVLNLLILVLGLRAVVTLPVLQYPRTENAVVTVYTYYYGADPDVIAGFVTTPLEGAIAQANGIDYMTSTSTTGASTITVNLRLNYDTNAALTEINTKIASVLNRLPEGTQPPTLTVEIGQTIDAMYIGFSSEKLAPNQITDYLTRIVQPKLQAVPGVQNARLLGAKNFALRAWLDPDKLAAYGLTAADVSQALASNDYIAGLGTTKGQMVQVTLSASTSLHTVEQFRDLVLKQEGGAIVRLGDVAQVSMGSEDYESQVSFDGQRAVYIGIQVAPAANLLDVIAGVRAVFPDIVAQFPQGLDGRIVYDSTKFVNASIDEVVTTLVEALIIVTLVVFVFLGSLRSVLIPTIAIPLSLIGTFTLMTAFGFSINLLTLLALVLAIGLVVDDAIIVVENVNRHLAEGMAPMPAALQAARELAGPIVAMTVVLVAVYVPIGFQKGLTGALFTEFAFTLAGAVTISGIVALTLSPVMCAHMLKPHGEGESRWEARFEGFIDRNFDRLRTRYARLLHGSLDYLPVTGTFAAIVLVSIWFLYNSTKAELSPQEDQGVVVTIATTAPTATIDQRLLYARQVYEIFRGHPETDHVFQMELPAQSIAGMVLKPWNERAATAGELMPQVQQQVNAIAGAKVAAFQPPPLPGARGLPIQFVISTTQGFNELNQVAQAFLQEALKSGRFMFLDTDLRIDRPMARVVIDRDKAAQLGLRMSDVGGALAWMLGGGYVNYFNLDGRSYRVMPQVERSSRLNPDQILNYHIRTADGAAGETSVPLSTIARIETKTIPQSLNHFQQLNAATIQGVAFPGVSQAEALEELRALANRTLRRATRSTTAARRGSTCRNRAASRSPSASR